MSDGEGEKHCGDKKLHGVGYAQTMDFRGCPISRRYAVTQLRQGCDKFLSIRRSTYRRSASACGQKQDCFRRLKVAPSHCAPLRSNDLCVRLDCGLKFAMERPMGSSSPPGTWRGWLSQRIAYLFSERAFHAFGPPAIGDAVVVVDHQESHDSKSLISLMFSITHNLHYPLYYTHRQLIAMDEARACAGSR